VEEREKMRASDADRQEVVERLRGALDEGRLKMDEYLERMGLAYDAVTYGDLEPLCSDLPESRAVARPEPAGAERARPSPAPPEPVAAADDRGAFARLPGPLRMAWIGWATIVSINVVVWVLVSVTTAQLIYPWPLWVAGPWGAVLFGVSAGVLASGRGRPSRRIGPGGENAPGRAIR
jgi:Domain of unknown function (DUF1707)